jgi:hypothetical protein
MRTSGSGIVQPGRLAVPLQIVLVHLGGEERTVDVLGIWMNKVQVRWQGGGIGGIYALDLKKNVLVGTRNQWRAKNIEEVKIYYRARRAQQVAFKH